MLDSSSLHESADTGEEHQSGGIKLTSHRQFESRHALFGLEEPFLIKVARARQALEATAGGK